MMGLYKKLRILLVDDEESIRNASSKVLCTKGYVVEVAENGHKALEKINENAYNVLITDYRMPFGMNGYELANRVKERGIDLFVILMSGEIDITEKKSNSIDLYLQKPFDMAELLNAVKIASEKIK